METGNRKETRGWWCPKCKKKTNSIMENGKLVCSICMREPPKNVSRHFRNQRNH